MVPSRSTPSRNTLSLAASPAAVTDRTRPAPVDLAPVLSGVIGAVRAAGTLLRGEFFRPGGPRGAGAHADADEEIEWLLRERLLALFPAYFRGEETGTQAAGPGGEDWCWLVDPQDGTSAFLQGYRGTAVSVALLRHGVPVLGVVHAPLSPDRGDDLIAWAAGQALTRNGVPVASDLRHGELRHGQIVFVSQAAPRWPEANAALCAPARFIAMPSIAYRLARVAVGDGVAAVSLNGPEGLDYAAGDALLRAAGGVLLDEQGLPVRYTVDGRSWVRHCFGGAPHAAAELATRDWPGLLRETTPMAPAGPGLFAGLAAPVRLRAGDARIADDAQLARAGGAMLGQLVGDSLGSLVEFLDPGEIAHRYPGGVRHLADGGCWGTLAGQPTDDSELALLLARALLASGDYDDRVVARAYADWLASGPFDSGNTTRVALAAAARARDGDAAAAARRAALRDSQANGSLMRVSPLGIFAAGDPQRAAALARADSRLTHPHPLCVESCAAYVAAIAAGVGGADAPGMHAAALAVLADDEAGAQVRGVLSTAAAGELPVAHGHQQGWVRIALQNAFHRLLHAASFEEGLIATVGLGGDTDTNGAIAGALLGARHGRDAIPGRWVLPVLVCRPLNGRAENPRPGVFWPSDAMELAEALLAAGNRQARNKKPSPAVNAQGA